MRSQIIDCYRGLGIILVLLGHSTILPVNGFNAVFPVFFYKLIYSFHMPAFFIMSGFLFNTKKASENYILYFKDKFFRLIVPAWTIGLICGATFSLAIMIKIPGFTKEDYFYKLVGTLTGLPGVHQNFLTSPLWFLFCLFGVEFVMALLFAKSNKAVFFAVLIGVSGAVFSNYLTDAVFFDINLIPLALLFFSVGVVIKSKSYNVPPCNYLRICSVGGGFLIWFTLVYYSPSSVSMAKNQIGTGIWVFGNILSALLGSYLLFESSVVLRKVKTISFFGKNTLPLLGFNFWVVGITVVVLDKINFDSWYVAFLIETIGLIGLVFLLRYLGVIGHMVNGSWNPRKN